jgi:hypothetical protein
MHARQERIDPGHGTRRSGGGGPDSPFGRWQGAGNRAIAGLLSRPVQRDEDAGGTDAAMPATDDTSRVDDMASAVLGTVDGAAVTQELRRDAAAQGGSASSATDGDAVQTVRADSSAVQRDPTTPPPTKPADLSDLLDAILALPTVKGLLDRLAEIAAREIKRAGAPATITLGAFVIPPLLVGLNQGLGVKKLVLKTPEIPLGKDAQGVQRSVRFRFEATVDPNSGGGGSLGAEFRF